MNSFFQRQGNKYRGRPITQIVLMMTEVAFKDDSNHRFKDSNKMKTLAYAIFLGLLAAFTFCDICFEPVSESQVILPLKGIEVYAAYNYTKGLIVFTNANSPVGSDYYMIDLVNNITFIRTSIVGCIKFPGYTEVFSQCLPHNAQYLQTIDEYDLYYVWRPGGLDWLDGVTLDEDTGFYQRFISLYGQGRALDVGITIQNNIGVSDPAVFNRNTSDCKWSYSK
ncbi:hypothetical protein ElyMa_003254000 [Elysia marginata]|uniref:Uncharacterized protein n=1 Tax=Elysia marginata TaxID=1093978 RepID=A0AAV4J6K1_9GAST|nr:hypothetical protein ElyMa_003254000 [Elysia marginata]